MPSRPELPETRGEFLEQKHDDLVRVLLSYLLIVFCLHTRIGFIDGSLIDKIHRQLGQCAAIALYGTCFKSAALRLLNLAIHREDLQTMWPDGIVTSLIFLASTVLASSSMGGISAFFFSMGDFFAKSLATPLGVQMVWVGVPLLVYEALLSFHMKTVRLWIKGSVRGFIKVLSLVGVSAGMMTGGRMLGDAIRAASRSAMTIQQELAALAGVVMMLGSMAAYYVIFMRQILRHLPPRPEFWPAWLPGPFGPAGGVCAC